MCLEVNPTSGTIVTGDRCGENLKPCREDDVACVENLEVDPTSGTIVTSGAAGASLVPKP